MTDVGKIEPLTPPRPIMPHRPISIWSRVDFGVVLLIFSLMMSARETALHYQNRRYLREVAQNVIGRAGAVDARAKILALRDYVRSHVTFEGASLYHRPFLRDSAADTLKSGRGYCGEVSRAFICLAREVGITAERINLTGSMLHVVAEAQVSPEESLIVDSQNPPTIADLEPLDKVMERPEFDDYYTINLRRLHVTWLVARLKLEPGPLTYFLEYPHRIKATLWALVAIAVASLRLARMGLRMFLRRRGWVHISGLKGSGFRP